MSPPISFTRNSQLPQNRMAHPPGKEIDGNLPAAPEGAHNSITNFPSLERLGYALPRLGRWHYSQNGRAPNITTFVILTRIFRTSILVTVGFV